jgi:hypothetical protein
MSASWISPGDACDLERMARALAAACRIAPDQAISAGPNRTGRHLLLPGHNTGDIAVYPSFWTRDPAWFADAGLVPIGDAWGWITLMTETMRGPEPWHLASGGVVPPWTVADHINLDGRPVYYPGTYACDETQGPPWGKFPPHDSAYWLALTARAYARRTEDWASFMRPVPAPGGERPLSELCELAYRSASVDASTCLCIADSNPARHTVDWGYTDSVTKTGALLVPSLLRLSAARSLAELFRRNGRQRRAERYHTQAERIEHAVTEVFYEPRSASSACLLSATGIGRKPDVWGSALAVYLDALQPPRARAISRWLLHEYRARTIVRQGQLRHIPTTSGSWELAQCEPGTYQNGAFWGYPVGWCVYALTLESETAAADLFGEYVGWLRETWTDDLRACAWECTNPELNHYQNPGYLATVALPYAALKARGLLPTTTP